MAQAKTDNSPYKNWQHNGLMAVITTQEGAALRESAAEANVPVLVRLHKDFFDFKQASPKGDDIRFSNQAGEALAYQVEHWDVEKGEASIWVRIPNIVGNARQPLRLHWGMAGATSESNGKAVFNETNGFMSVWHMSDPVKDESGTVAALGMIGPARHFPGKMGVFCGDKITNYPQSDSPHSSEAWFRCEQSNSTIIGWGNEGGNQGSKVRMQFRSPPHIHVDSDFSDVSGESRLPMAEWIHVVHTYSSGDGKIYINGKLDGEAKPKLNIKSPAHVWLGGWYNNYDFIGDLDEARISKVARSADWVRLQYENQKPLQTLVGPLIQAGAEFAVSQEKVSLAEGKSVTITAKAGGAQKIYWILKDGAQESIVAVDRFSYTLDAGRVEGDKPLTLQLKAVYSKEVKTKDIAITIKEDIAEPVFTLKAPAAWDGRTAIEIVPQVSNLAAMKAKGAGGLKVDWNCGNIAVIKKAADGKLLLKGAQNSGKLEVTATMSNGGKPVTQSISIAVTEPKTDPWLARIPTADEKPQEGQFYARDDKNEGTLFYNGALEEAADTVFLKLYADDKLEKTESLKLSADKSYALTVKLKPGLTKYKVEFGSKKGTAEKVHNTVGNIVCGDAYIIDGQSNALATDTGEKSAPETSEWIRSYGRPSADGKEATENLWCLPVWKASSGEKAELGWWGMELAKRLLASQKVPIFMINAAAGGTRIDQHQRSESNPTDLTTLYGKMLWRVQQAKLSHGIRGILWHQGENDQGSDGPTGGYGWESYHRLFLEMSAAWKEDFPNVRHYYIFQIWPNSCSMGGGAGSGDMLREKQRTLPQYYSNMSIMSTLGVRPPGGCHFPLVGWAEFARMIQPLIERDNYRKVPTESITPPNLLKARSNGKDTIELEFDQPVGWADVLTGQFYLDGEKDKVASGSVKGNVLTLKLKEPGKATKITYLKEVSWNQETLLLGVNGIAALTFCNVPIAAAP